MENIASYFVTFSIILFLFYLLFGKRKESKQEDYFVCDSAKILFDFIAKARRSFSPDQLYSGVKAKNFYIKMDKNGFFILTLNEFRVETGHQFVFKKDFLISIKFKGVSIFDEDKWLPGSENLKNSFYNLLFNSVSSNLKQDQAQATKEEK